MNNIVEQSSFRSLENIQLLLSILEIVEAPGRKKEEDRFAAEVNSIMEQIEKEIQNTEGKVELFPTYHFFMKFPRIDTLFIWKEIDQQPLVTYRFCGRNIINIEENLI